MDYKKSTAPNTTITRDLREIEAETGNVYESINAIFRRSNQISAEIKEELSRKLEEFASYSDNLEEVFENREQIEISRFYERLPKSNAIATDEFIEGKVYYRQADEQAKPISRD
ncbi:MAG: DNA-directed RNA polymerase subunit omega [Salinivirgaceae bacterium]|jgi:predicted nuclease with TOPRIM domain|nr:DNA-directed RNA polymerase subunit omega [Salinivirgaceae bacterium]